MFQSYREIGISHLMFNIFLCENHAVFETMWKNIAELGRPQMTIWRMPIAFWIFKGTNTHTEYVIFIAFPMQRYQERKN